MKASNRQLAPSFSDGSLPEGHLSAWGKSSSKLQINEPPKDRRQRERRYEDQKLAKASCYQNRIRSLRTIGLYFALALFTTSTFLGFESNDYGEISIDNFTSKFNSIFEEKNNFDLNGVSLGMTPNRIREIYPNLSTQISKNGATKGKYSSDGANYNVTFQNHKGKQQAAIIRYNKNFNKLSEQQLLAHIGKKFGLPISTDCTRSAYTQSTKCKYNWWLKGGATLAVTSTQTRNPSGTIKTKLTMVATDSYLAGRNNRSAKKSTNAPPIRSLNAIALAKNTPVKKAETLPF